MNRDENPNTFPGSEIGILAYNNGNLFVWDNNIFDDVNTSIDSRRNNNNITGNTIKSGINGIYVKNISKKICRIDRNSIRTSKEGINISNANVIISHNDITSLKAVTLNSVNPYIGFGFSSFLKNSLSTYPGDGSMAIKANFPYQIQFLQNPDLGVGNVSINQGLQLLIANANLWYGHVNFHQIYNSTIEENGFGDTFIKGSSYNRFDGNGFAATADILLSSLNDYVCNSFSDQVTIKFNCLGSDFLHNIFSTDFTLAESGTVISPQTNRGNDFNGVTANYQTEIFNLADNTFIVKNAPPFVPAIVNGPATWFNPIGGNQPDCMDVITEGLIPTWTGNLNNKCLDSLFLGTKYAKYTPKQKWILVFTLYRIYSKINKKFPLTLSECAKKILFTYKIKDIGKLASAYDKIDSLRGLVPSGPITSSLTPAMASLSALVQAGADENAVHTQWQQIDNISNAQAGEIAAWQTSYDALKADILTEANEAAVLSIDEPAIHMSALVPMLLAALEGDYDYFDAAKKEYLLSTAEACPNDVGLAKYTAMTLYSTVTGIDLDENLGSCSPVQEIRNLSRAVKSEVIIYPNPSSDFITIETTQPSRVEICDITGHQVLKTSTIDNKSLCNITHLNDGLYIVKCTTVSGDVIVQKFIKQ